MHILIFYCALKYVFVQNFKQLKQKNKFKESQRYLKNYLLQNTLRCLNFNHPMYFHR